MLTGFLGAELAGARMRLRLTLRADEGCFQGGAGAPLPYHRPSRDDEGWPGADPLRRGGHGSARDGFVYTVALPTRPNHHDHREGEYSRLARVRVGRKKWAFAIPAEGEDGVGEHRLAQSVVARNR